jgi:hypothetical protein
MLAAVCFNDQTSFLAYEIRNERTNRLLSSEFNPLELAIAQNGP